MAHDPLTALEQDAIQMIRDPSARLRPPCMPGSSGKDSNSMLWLAREAFAGRVPVPVVLLDAANGFGRVCALRDRYDVTCEGIPVCELDYARGGKRFRSRGEGDATFPVASTTSSVDAGRPTRGVATRFAGPGGPTALRARQSSPEGRAA